MLELNLARQGTATVVKILGRIDHANVQELETILAGQFQEGQYQIILDLSTLDVVFSIAIGVLWANCQKARARGGDIVLLGVQPSILSILETLGIDGELRRFEDLDQALACFSKA